jgi:saccharopine dehydrogenase-like NADP-dependent oxidoreductase
MTTSDARIERILILGGGQQGRVLAADLRRSLPDRKIDVADIRPGVGDIQEDLSQFSVLVRLMGGYDLIVGALPSRFGFQSLRAAVEARRPMVDLSFCPESARSLDSEARNAGISICPDCGLAPGLSNLLVGHLAAQERLEALTIEVGGVAEEPTLPYGYVVTWSLDDLVEEYTRPARIRTGGCVETVPALSDLKPVDIRGIGRMESFRTDGLRTLLDYDRVPTMDERTLRWPGHVEQVRPLLARRALVETLRQQCTFSPPRDLVVMRISAPGGKGSREILLIDRYDGVHTAMSRTTAFTCSAVVQWVVGGGRARAGVVPLEDVGADPQACRFILDCLSSRGIRMVGATPA